MNAQNISRPSKAPKPITQAQIAALAHELWLAEGSPAGSDVDIWLEAERQLHGLPPRTDRDPIPADLARFDPDEDLALKGDLERELDEVVAPRNGRSPTSLP